MYYPRIHTVKYTVHVQTFGECEGEGDVVECLPEVCHALFSSGRRTCHVNNISDLRQSQFSLLLGTSTNLQQEVRVERKGERCTVDVFGLNS